MVGTLYNPGKFDRQPLPDEPFFTLLARSQEFPQAVCGFVELRQRRLTHHPKELSENSEMLAEAMQIAGAGALWRHQNALLTPWRGDPAPPAPVDMDRVIKLAVLHTIAEMRARMVATKESLNRRQVLHFVDDVASLPMPSLAALIYQERLARADE